MVGGVDRYLNPGLGLPTIEFGGVKTAPAAWYPTAAMASKSTCVIPPPEVGMETSARADERTPGDCRADMTEEVDSRPGESG